jgi:hypothetical protein
MIGDDTSRSRIWDMMGKKEFEITYRSKQMQGKFSATLETFALFVTRVAISDRAGRWEKQDKKKER